MEGEQAGLEPDAVAGARLSKPGFHVILVGRLGRRDCRLCKVDSTLERGLDTCHPGLESTFRRVGAVQAGDWPTARTY